MILFFQKKYLIEEVGGDEQIARWRINGRTIDRT